MFAGGNRPAKAACACSNEWYRWLPTSALLSAAKGVVGHCSKGAVRRLLTTGKGALALPWEWVYTRAPCIRFGDSKIGPQARPIGAAAVALLSWFTGTEAPIARSGIRRERERAQEELKSISENRMFARITHRPRRFGFLRAGILQKETRGKPRVISLTSCGANQPRVRQLLRRPCWATSPRRTSMRTTSRWWPIRHPRPL